MLQEKVQSESRSSRNFPNARPNIQQPIECIKNFTPEITPFGIRCAREAPAMRKHLVYDPHKPKRRVQLPITTIISLFMNVENSKKKTKNVIRIVKRIVEAITILKLY